MAPNDSIIERPNFPEHFSAGQQAQWHKTFKDALEQSKVDSPEGAFHHQTARREANRHFRVPILRSYADAMTLERWQYKERKTIGADRIAALGYEPQGPGEHLAVVTIDGKKYFFAVPSDVDADAADNSGDGADGKKGKKK